eukprot:365810-Chlamydomonas_euryale.AAC.29
MSGWLRAKRSTAGRTSRQRPSTTTTRGVICVGSGRRLQLEGVCGFTIFTSRACAWPVTVGFRLWALHRPAAGAWDAAPSCCDTCHNANLSLAARRCCRSLICAQAGASTGGAAHLISLDVPFQASLRMIHSSFA